METGIRCPYCSVGADIIRPQFVRRAAYYAGAYYAPLHPWFGNAVVDGGRDTSVGASSSLSTLPSPLYRISWFSATEAETASSVVK